MQIKQKIIKTFGIKLYIKDGDKEIARAFLFILYNDYRRRKYGFMEDVFVDEEYRGQGLASKLVKEIFKFAKKYKCYKIVATSRHERIKVHRLYKKLGFKKFGIEFKMYLKN